MRPTSTFSIFAGMNYPNRLVLLLAIVLPCPLFCQLTIQITGLPPNTPEQAPLFAAGSFNNWNPGDTAFRFNEEQRLVINPPAGQLEFKITRGSWASVEGNEEGVFLPNRVLQYTGKPQTVSIQVVSWEDQPIGVGRTAAPNVYILSDSFYMPQLNRKRRIWIYLPPDYALSRKRYPVLYLHDGQNLFDAASSSFGEWQIDESLNSLFAQGDYGCIAIGIDNGQDKRLDEYSPWVHPKYGGGEGQQYIRFITHTLKPFIDSVYRTLPTPETTALMGSSMGGLISMYGFAEHQDIFGIAGVFSPSVWFARDAALSHVAGHSKRVQGRVYLLAGGQEPSYLENDLTLVGNALLQAGYAPWDIYYDVPADGQHSEWFWRREFPKAYKWLLGGVAPRSRKTKAVRFGLELSPDVEKHTFQLHDIEHGTGIQVRVIGRDGKIWHKSRQHGGVVSTAKLPRGEYSILVKQRRQNWKMGKLILK